MVTTGATAASDGATAASPQENTLPLPQANGADGFSQMPPDWAWVWTNQGWSWMWSADIARIRGDLYGWTQTVGWFKFDSSILRNTQSFPRNTANAARQPSAVAPTAVSQSSAGGATARSTNYEHEYTGWNRWHSGGYYYQDKPKDGDVPEWDGTTHRTVYYRKIDLWAASTGVPPELRAIRLL